MNDIYQAPSAELTEVREQGEYGSLERAVEGDYEFDIGDVIKEGWSKVPGNKWSVQVAVFFYFVFYMVVLFALQFGVYGLFGLDPIQSNPSEMGQFTGKFAIASVIDNVLLTAITAPVTAGLCMLCVRLAMDEPAPAGFIFGFFNKLLPLFLTCLLMYVLLIVGFLLLVLPGIYLSIAYMMAIPLVVEKNLSPWQALEMSRKAVSKRWFAMFGFYFLMMLLAIVATIPLGIGWIWFLPMSMISYGIIYRNMFGVEAETLNR